MVERVFRICKYTKLSRSRWKLKKRFLYDDEKYYKLGIKKNTQACDHRGAEGPLYVRFTGEEFVNGTWIEILRHPPEEGFDEDEQRKAAAEKMKKAKKVKTAKWAEAQKDAENDWQEELDKRR